jgi:allantoate deiminase
MTQYEFGTPVVARLSELAAITDTPGRLTRLYLSKAHVKAIDIVSAWMRDAGMRVHVDSVGNVIGRYEAATSNAVALLIGSHIDTVVDAGRYDGALGVVAAITVVAELNRRRRRYPFAIEVAAFGDEEGVRFPSTLFTSRALAGTADPRKLDGKDADGISLRDALRQIHSDADITVSARKRQDFFGYLEVHIEQGPVLESENRALAIVSAINGASRYRFEIDGRAGHAGTVPMSLRRDALAATAEIVLSIEAEAQSTPELVATVGQLAVEPGAVNVIPGKVTFTLDIRGPEDSVRQRATLRILDRAQVVANKRGTTLSAEPFHHAPAVRCDPRLMQLLSAALRQNGHQPRLLASGAGHDAMAIADLCPVVMLFVRCAGGISHHPAESASIADVDAAIRVILSFIDQLEAQRTFRPADAKDDGSPLPTNR